MVCVIIGVCAFAVNTPRPPVDEEELWVCPRRSKHIIPLLWQGIENKPRGSTSLRVFYSIISHTAANRDKVLLSLCSGPFMVRDYYHPSRRRRIKKWGLGRIIMRQESPDDLCHNHKRATRPREVLRGVVITGQEWVSPLIPVWSRVLNPENMITLGINGLALVG